MRFTDFKIPSSVEEASAVLKELGDDAFVVAGGTSLAFQKGKGAKTAVDISRLGLDGVEKEPDGYVIKAGTRIADLQEYRGEGWVLDRVASLFSTQQIRNASTIGGNVARIFPWNDFPIALLALECVLVVGGGQERQVRGEEYFSSQPHKRYGKGDILTAIKVKPLPPGAGFGYRKETRTFGDFSMATAAAVVELHAGRIKSLRVAVGAALPLPKRLERVEALLLGKAVKKRGLDEGLWLPEVEKGVSEVQWRGRGGVSDEYAGRLATVAVRDAIADAAKDAMGGSDA